MMHALMHSLPVLLTLTLGAYLLGVWVKKAAGQYWGNKASKVLHPLLVCVPLIIVVLLVSGVSCEDYMEANKFISFLLGPSVVALGLKLYDNRQIVRENMTAILTSVLVGSIVSIASVIAVGFAFGLPQALVQTLEPKSVTTPIAMDVVSALGGNASLIAVTVVLSGFVGNLIGPWVLRLARVKHPIARGTAYGCSSHGLGTARALEEGALCGAVSGLCIALMGVATAIIVPFFVH